ncbi:MAG: ATP-grasp domain-containing protein [Myxococcales bacterium]|nr:ATP-grasp domain-containing protein [Myxococcales bacterium]
MIGRGRIRRLAIVNRGEAALRCIRAVKALRALEGSDLRCISFYTPVDRDAPFVRHADESVRLEPGSGSAVSAYLDHAGLLDTLDRCGADSVWPGWGFVAEDATFADRVVAAGIRFLGPSGDVMRTVGDKIASKQVAEQAGVPVIPWSRGAVGDDASAHAEAEKIGYPLLIKASAGGGGRGIRAVDRKAGFAEALRAARAEAHAAFGDDRLFLEKRLSGGRHVEVQIAADAHGRVLALGCRDCSVQRRHQKILEEAPPPGLDQRVIEALQDCSVRLAQSVGYVGVGTVEFLISGEDFAFLEVNPRLQVEHGITEELTGVDLVQLQIRIARGESLPERAPLASGCAIEARVCAEDPEADFLPAPGRIARFDPALGPRIRVDTGVAAGSRVPADFDSLIAKVIAVGDTREDARARLVAALADFELVVEGGATNKGYLIDLLETPAYRSAAVDTEWLDKNPLLRQGSKEFAVEALVAAAVLSYQRARDRARGDFWDDPSHVSPASIPASDGQRIDLSRHGQSYRLEVFTIGAWRYRVHLDGRVVQVKLRNEGENRSILEMSGRTLRVVHDANDRGLRLEVEGRPYRFGNALAGQVRAGTPAMVVAIRVQPGDVVASGQSIGLLEAMKMEIGFEAPVAGVVKEIFVRGGQQVAAGELLLAIEPAGEDIDSREGARLALRLEPDPLEIFFGGVTAAGEVVDLHAAEKAALADRRAAIEAARDEIRRVLMGYDVNPERGEKLVAFLDAPLPADLSEDFCWELASIRHELTLFVDIEELFSRAPQSTASGAPGPSVYNQLREFVRRYALGGGVLSDTFEQSLMRAFAHYGVADLTPSDALERALVRLLASQLNRDLRMRLVQGSVRRVLALATSGIHLGDDTCLDEALARAAGLRGLVSDTLADLSLEARYAIFEGPLLRSEVERTTKEVETWLAAAESELTPPPAAVLAHLASAPRNVFDRVGRWLEDADARRRAVAVATHVRRFYVPSRPVTHTSGVVGSVHVERLDLEDGRIVLGSVARRSDLAATLERLGRAAQAAAVRAPTRRVAAIELLVPTEDETGIEALREAIAPLLRAPLAAERLTVSMLAPAAPPWHETFTHDAGGMLPLPELRGIHPQTAERIDLERLRNFEWERLDAPEDLYCFHVHSAEISGDERILVLADVRGRSPDVSEGREASLHVPAFERDFFEACRCLRNHLGVRDPRRRMQWNRISLFVTPTLFLDSELVERLSRRLAPATRNLGLEKVVVRLNVLDRNAPDAPPRQIEIVFRDPTGSRMELSWREPHHAPLEPAQDYERKVVEARRRKLVYPYEIIRMLTGGPGAVDLGEIEIPAGRFEEYDLEAGDAGRVAVSVAGRPHAGNTSAIVFGIIDTPTEQVPEGVRRVLILSDPTVGMGSLAAPECDRIVAALDLAERLALPVEWIPISSGARIAMDSGTENLDATARVVRRIVTFTQAGGIIHIIVHGINVGAQSYFDALSTMLQHTRGVLIMTPGASMVLTGRAALEASGSVSAEDETAIGGFERIMGPNGEAQYYAHNLAEAYAILYQHYRYSYVVPGEAAPRRHATADPDDRRITEYQLDPAEDAEFSEIREIFDAQTNPDRKRPFSMRVLMAALIDQDRGHLERWRAWLGAETTIVWDACLGGHPISLVGIESRNLARGGDHPADGPASWTGGTLFPLSSKKMARALNAASGIRPAVILANLSGFDGSPESMRKLQLEYGAEIARAVVNFRGPLLFLVVSRYHGGAYVVFSPLLNSGVRAAAVEGSFASVIGGGPAAAVVFAREARARALREPRLAALRRDAQAAPGSRAREALDAAYQDVLLEKQAELAAEFDAIHTVERARDVGSLESIIAAEDIRPYLIDLLRGQPD